MKYWKITDICPSKWWKTINTNYFRFEKVTENKLCNILISGRITFIHSKSFIVDGQKPIFEI